MFAKNTQGNYIRVDNAELIGVSQSGSEWHVWKNADADVNKLGVFTSEIEARDAQDEIAGSVGIVEIS